MRSRFWERFSLGELNSKEWEALCDGCGQCCLLRDVDDTTVTVYGVACELLDIEKARCSDYANRLQKAPHCHKLTPTTVPEYTWLPETCAYRRIHEGKGLPSWHPLLVGSRREMHERGITVSHYAVRAEDVPKRRMSRHVVARWPVAAVRDAARSKASGSHRRPRRSHGGKTAQNARPEGVAGASRQKEPAARRGS